MRGEKGARTSGGAEISKPRVGKLGVCMGGGKKIFRGGGKKGPRGLPLQ